MTHEWFEVQFSYGGWIECTCGFRPTSQEDMDNHGKEFDIMRINVNEDLVLTLESTSGKMRISPMNGVWMVEKINEETGQVEATVTGLPDFVVALETAMRTIFNPVAVLQAEQTLKAKVVGGLAGPMMEEYREKALQAGEGI